MQNSLKERKKKKNVSSIALPALLAVQSWASGAPALNVCSKAPNLCYPLKPGSSTWGPQHLGGLKSNCSGVPNYF